MVYKIGDRVKIYRKVEHSDTETIKWNRDGKMDKTLGRYGIITSRYSMSENAFQVDTGVGRNWYYLQDCFEPEDHLEDIYL